MVTEDQNKKDGKLLLIISIASIFLWLLASSGYNPKLGSLGSFFHSMYLFSYKNCNEVDKSTYQIIKEKVMYGDDVHQNPYVGRKLTRTECTTYYLRTKYLVLISLFFLTYGVLIMNNLSPNLFRKIRPTWMKIKKGTRGNIFND